MQVAADTEVGITTEGNTVSWSDISDALRDVREHLILRLTTGACATRFLYELAGHWCRMAAQIRTRLRLMPCRLASPCSVSPPWYSWTIWRLNSIEYLRCVAMGFSSKARSR